MIQKHWTSSVPVRRKVSTKASSMSTPNVLFDRFQRRGWHVPVGEHISTSMADVQCFGVTGIFTPPNERGKGFARHMVSEGYPVAWRLKMINWNCLREIRCASFTGFWPVILHCPNFLQDGESLQERGTTPNSPLYTAMLAPSIRSVGPVRRKMTDGRLGMKSAPSGMWIVYAG